MKKYIDFGIDDALCGRYDSSIHKSIPKTAIEVSDSIFRQTINETDGIWKIDRETGKIEKHPFPPEILTHDQVWDRIQAVRTEKQAGGFPVDVDGKNYWFHSDESSRVQQLGLVQLGKNIPPDLWWKTMSGEFVTMTATLANNVLLAAIAADTAIFAVAEHHKAEMMCLDDPTDYDYSSGWPQVYADRLSK